MGTAEDEEAGLLSGKRGHGAAARWPGSSEIEEYKQTQHGNTGRATAVSAWNPSTHRLNVTAPVPPTAPAAPAADTGNQQGHAQHVARSMAGHRMQTSSNSGTNLWRGFQLLFTFAMAVLAVYLGTAEPHKEIAGIPTWRWMVLCACLCPTWYIPEIIIFLAVLLLESKELLGGTTVYLLIGVKVHAVRLLRVLAAELVVLLVLFPQRKEPVLALQLWTCFTIMLTANLLKALLARLMSRHFHSRAYFERMQLALRKEQLLIALSQPNPKLPMSGAGDFAGALFAGGLNGLSALAQQYKQLVRPGSGGGAASAPGPPTEGLKGDAGVASNPAGIADTKGVSDAASSKPAADVVIDRQDVAPLAVKPAAVAAQPPAVQSAVQRSTSPPPWATSAATPTVGAGSSGSGLYHIPAASTSQQGDATIPANPSTTAAHVTTVTGGSSVTDSFKRVRTEVEESEAVRLLRSTPGSASTAARSPLVAAAPGMSFTSVFAAQSQAAVLAAMQGSGAGGYEGGMHTGGTPPQLAATASGIWNRLRDSWRAAHLSPEELEQMVGAQVQGQALGPPLPAPDGLLQPTAFSSVPQTTAALAAVMAPSAVSMQPSLLTRPATGNQPSLTHYQSLNHHHLNNSLGHSNILRASAGEGGTMFNSAGVGNSLSGQAASGSGIVQPVPLNPTVARVGSIEFSDASFFWLERHLRSNKLRLSVTEQLGKVADDSQGDDGGVANSSEARQLALYLFWNIVGRDLSRTSFGVADLLPFFPSVAQAAQAFALLSNCSAGSSSSSLPVVLESKPAKAITAIGGQQKGQAAAAANGNRKGHDEVQRVEPCITLPQMVDAVLSIYKERKKLALTLKDTNSVVGKLELICGVVLHIIALGFYLAIFQVSIQQLWVTISSVALAFAFVFGNSIRSIYEAVLYLFVVHPFDVGDVLQLANGEVAKVEEIALQFTTFLRIDGRRMLYPNPKLITEPCINLSRSERLFDSITLVLDTGAPAPLLDDMEAALRRQAASSPEDYTGAVAVFARSLEQGKLQVVARFEYTHTGEEVPYTNRCRSGMLLALAATLDEAGVTYTTAPQVVYNLDMPITTLLAAQQDGAITEEPSHPSRVLPVKFPCDMRGLAAAVASTTAVRRP